MSAKYWTARAFFTLLAALPLSLSRAAGAAIGRLMLALGNRNARIAEINLGLCFPEMDAQQRRTLLEQRMAALGAMALELGKVWGASAQASLQLIREVEGRDKVDAALAQGKGLIILAPHLGNWEVVGLYLTECCPVVRSMYAPPSSATMNRIILEARQRTGADLVPANRSGVAQLLRTLRDGHIVGILPDQVPADESGVYAPFFARPAFSMTLMSNLAQRTGAAVINAYALPQKGGFKLVFEDVEPGLYSAELQESVAAMNKTIEKSARQHPAHYQWEYKRFKRPQPGQAAVY